MKKIIIFIFAAVFLFLDDGCTTPQARPNKQTYSSFDLPTEHSSTKPTQPNNATMPAGTINFQGAQLNQVLDIYAHLSQRTVLHGPLPAATIILQTTTPLSRIEVLQAFDTVLAQNGVAMVLSGEKAVKAVPVSQMISENPPEITLPWNLLPDSSSPMTRTVHLKNLKASEVLPILMPFSKLPNSIVAIQDQNVLIIRDYSSSIKQELRLLEDLERKTAR